MSHYRKKEGLFWFSSESNFTLISRSPKNRKLMSIKFSSMHISGREVKPHVEEKNTLSQSKILMPDEKHCTMVGNQVMN